MLKTNTSITSLNLEGNDIEDEGAQACVVRMWAWVRVVGCRQRHLQATWHSLSAPGPPYTVFERSLSLKALAEMLKTNTIVKRIVLAGNDIEEDGVEAAGFGGFALPFNTVTVLLQS